VTQAAVAVVGATVVSSLLTIGAFVLVLRYKRNRKRRRTLRAAATDGISYPALNGSSNGYEPGGYEANAGFPSDIKEPPRAVVAPDGGGDRNTTTIGYATSGHTANPSDGSSDFHLRTPPKGKFTLFPRSREEGERLRSASPNGSIGGDSESNYSSGGGGGDERASQQPQQQRASMMVPPSLDTWLRAGTVSPFGTLDKGNGTPIAKKGPNWPLSRKG
jgi:hypothetical protein